MSSKDGTLFSAKKFAAAAGVTVRTLHLYDREGLLKPSARTASGYRLYGEAELERLEHIVALRFVGFGLDQIRELLNGPARPLIDALHMQREVIGQQKLRLETAIDAIAAAECALAANASADRWKTLSEIIGVFKMQNDWSWTQNYYTQEDREKLAERMKDTSADLVAHGQRDWTALIAEVEAAKDEDPASDRAQALARRWRDPVAQFTGGNAGIQKGLNRLWSDPSHWPKGFKKPWSDAADAFIKRAMSCAG